MNRKSLIIDLSDTVGCMLEDGKKGDMVQTPQGEKIVLLEDIEFAHKVSIKDMKRGDPVIKYGQEIGYMLCDAPQGTWIHIHNMGCDRGKIRKFREDTPPLDIKRVDDHNGDK